MEDLDEKWIKRSNEQQCEHDEKTPATLGLKNMAGVFILVAAGIVGGVGLIFIEIMYKRHQIRRQRRLELARHVADKWRAMVEVRLHFNHFNLIYNFQCLSVYDREPFFAKSVLNSELCTILF